MQTIGDRLEEARKRKGISIREASESTKIRSDYLQKFESNSFELNLPDIYVRGFLRSYAQYLKLNTEKLLTDYASLGLGSPRDARDSRRHETRESFGRIDLAEAGGKSAPSPAPSQDNAGARNQPQQARSVPTSVVTGAPSADRRQKFKTSFIVGGAALALLLLIIILRAILPGTSDSRPSSASSSTHNTPLPTVAAENPENVLRLIAIDNVRVKVTQQSYKKVLFDGDLVKGETRAIERNGKVNVTYDIGKNLQVEIRGKIYHMTIEGWGRNSLD